MKDFKTRSILVLFLAILIPFIGYTQESNNDQWDFEVDKIKRPLSISKSQLTEANTLLGLNEYYKSSWVKEYKFVEIWTYENGEEVHAVSNSETLSLEQKTNLLNADNHTDIKVKVIYLPDSDMKNNEIKEMGFTFRVNPEKDASFEGGEEEMFRYLKHNAVDKISYSNFREYNLTAVKFTIDVTGHIINVHVFESSRNEEVDSLLVETLCNMPKWQPAEYGNGQKVNQEFVFLLGDMSSCVINLINLQRS